jgi:transcriptional regulator with XRE-family HTH domain
MADEPQKSAGGVLRRRYVKDDPARARAVERERINAEVAQLIYDRRTSAGLTQKQLADLLGTRQSVISRLEDADYEGHSLGMLQRVAGALNQRLHVQMTPLGGNPAAREVIFPSGSHPTGKGSKPAAPKKTVPPRAAGSTSSVLRDALSPAAKAAAARAAKAGKKK